MDTEALRQRAQMLIAAIAAYAEAKLAYEAALDSLKDARARILREGLEEQDKEVLEAQLLEKTREEEEAMRSARAVLRVAEANLEMARVTYNLEMEVARLEAFARRAKPELLPD